MNKEQEAEWCNSPDARFAKHPEAAASFLLAVGNTLLDGDKLPRVLEITLANIFRSTALAALNNDNKEAGKILLEALGLKKGGGEQEFARAARNGATNIELAGRFNIGKNETAGKRALLETLEREHLDNLTTYTLDHLLRAIAESGPGTTTSNVTEVLRDRLTPQFRLLSSDEISNHIQAALELARTENLITVTGSTIARNF